VPPIGTTGAAATAGAALGRPAPNCATRFAASEVSLDARCTFLPSAPTPSQPLAAPAAAGSPSRGIPGRPRAWRLSGSRSTTRSRRPQSVTGANCEAQEQRSQGRPLPNAGDGASTVAA
jgi:hypothetical protein